MRTLATTLCLLAAGALPAADFAIIGATVHTVSGPVYEDGIILVEDGKIVEVGGAQQVAIPVGTFVKVARGMHIYPSLIAADTVLGLAEIGSVRGTIDTTEVGEISPHVRAEVAVNPDSELLPVAVSNGVLLAGVSPHGGLVSGTSALLATSGWTWEEMTLRSPTGLWIAWPGMAIRRGPDVEPPPDEQEKERARRLRAIRDAFRSARAWHIAREAAGEAKLPRHENDARWEAMGPVLSGEVPVFVRARKKAQIEAALDWAGEEGLDIVIVGGTDAWRLAGRLSEEQVPVILDPVLALPSRDYEAYDTPFAAAARLHEAGAPFCISTGAGPFAAASVRNLPYHAAMAVAFGLPKDEALKAITLYPATILGVGDRFGSIEPGKEATLIATDGDILEVTTVVRGAWLAGVDLDLEDRHKRLYDKYRARPRPGGMEPSKLVAAP
jgi:imidazolonepropionase-like amidohydrolase